MSEAVSESVTDLSVGSHTVTARYLADGDFGDSDGTLPGGETVNPAPQTVAFTSTPPTPAAVGGTSTPTATGGVSGNPIVFSIDSTSAPSTCTIAGSTVSFTGVGTCVIPNQAGNADYSAGQAQQSVSIGQGSQSIAFTSSAPTEAVVAGPTYTPTATGGGSGNPITFRIDNSPQAVCSISPESVVSFIAAGTCTIDANQAGNANYLPATEVQQSFAVSATAGSPPAITSATSTTFASGGIGSFTITASGSPAPALSESGTLPAGVTFLDNGNGTGTLAGTPSGARRVLPDHDHRQQHPRQHDPGVYAHDRLLARDHLGELDQLHRRPARLVHAHDRRVPSSVADRVGALPAGVTFTDNGDGTATIVGTITAASVGTFSVKITATNSSGSVVQSLTLTVISGNLMITSAASTILTAGVAGTFTVTATGTPTPTITRQGALPAGITFSAPTAGAATMSGTPAAHDSGLYTINLLATSSSGKTSQTFTFSIDQPPTITSAHSATETAGTPFSFAVTTRGYPTAIMSQTGTLPAGVTFKSNGNGTATIGGTAASGSSSLMLQAATAVGIATQAFTLAVKPAASSPPTVPAFTSPALATTTAGSPFNFQVTTASSSATKLTRSGALPSGLTFTNNGNGTATINGTPTSAGQFTITITAKNSGTRRPVVRAHRQPNTFGHQRRHSDRDRRVAVQLRRRDQRLPATWTHTSRGPPRRAQLHRQRQRHRQHRRYPGRRNRRAVHDHDHRHQPTRNVQPDARAHRPTTPTITSPTAAQATHGTAFSFQFTASGYPPPTLTHTGSVARTNVGQQRERHIHAQRHTKDSWHLHVEHHRDEQQRDGHTDLHVDSELG